MSSMSWARSPSPARSRRGRNRLLRHPGQCRRADEVRRYQADPDHPGERHGRGVRPRRLQRFRRRDPHAAAGGQPGRCDLRAREGRGSGAVELAAHPDEPRGAGARRGEVAGPVRLVRRDVAGLPARPGRRPERTRRYRACRDRAGRQGRPRGQGPSAELPLERRQRRQPAGDPCRLHHHRAGTATEPKRYTGNLDAAFGGPGDLRPGAPSVTRAAMRSRRSSPSSTSSPPPTARRCQPIC